MKEAVANLNRFRAERQEEPIETGIGLATGPVISGRIGSHHGRLDFTVIGDTVNLAARLESEAGRATSSGILVSAATRRAAGEPFRFRDLGELLVKGKGEAVEVSELW